MDRYSDAALLQAVRKRLLADIGNGHGQSQMQRVVNNVYGNSPSPAAGGVMGHLGGGAGNVSPEDDPYSYMVDIAREPTPTGGWTKKVHRYKQPRGEVIEDEKKK